MALLTELPTSPPPYGIRAAPSLEGLVDEDEDGGGGDDAADALRYLVATKSRSISKRKLRGL
jgi:hypothetical protein